MSSNASDGGTDHSPSSSDGLLCATRSPLRPRRLRGTCTNVVRHVNFTVRQDGPGGITGLSVDFAYADVSLDSRLLTQSYSVSFVWSSNESSSSGDSGRRSGNPGYQVGLPILAATNGSDEMFQEAGLSVLDRGGDGLCSRVLRRAVRFGRNLKTGCSLENTFSGCPALQSAVSDVLLGGPGERQIYVGAFGNANASEPDDWIEVFHEAGGPLPDEGCHASLGLEVDVVFAAVGTVANPQHKIVGVRYRYSRPEPVEVGCAPVCRNLDLSTSVSFFDVTLPAVERYSKVPSIKANLPSDFFYPFLYGGGSKGGPSAAYLVSAVLLCLLRVELYGGINSNCL